MTASIKQIQMPVRREMIEFEHKFKALMKSKVPLLNAIMNFIVKRKGKQIRPMLVFLCAKLCGEFKEATFRGASLIELLHTATLIHDDVVDTAQYRRDFFSINALWKNKIAVLVGDFLFSRGLLLSIDHNDFVLLKIVSDSVREMSEGELLQIEKSRSLNITEDVYLKIIRQKTATLISSCCEVGACSVGAGEQIAKTMKYFGEKVGIAYQIKDDLFDYGTEEIGKPLGIDIQEKKMTLPLIYALNRASKAERRHIIYQIKNNNKKNKKVAEVIEFVKKSGGLEYAHQKMEYYMCEARALLNTFKDSPYKTALMHLTTYFVERKK